MTEELKVKSISKLLNRIVVPKVNEIIGDNEFGLHLTDIVVKGFIGDMFNNKIYIDVNFVSPHFNDSGFKSGDDNLTYGLCDFIMNTCEYVLSYHEVEHIFFVEVYLNGEEIDRAKWGSNGDRESNVDTYTIIKNGHESLLKDLELWKEKKQ